MTKRADMGGGNGGGGGEGGKQSVWKQGGGALVGKRKEAGAEEGGEEVGGKPRHQGRGRSNGGRGGRGGSSRGNKDRRLRTHGDDPEGNRRIHGGGRGHKRGEQSEAGVASRVKQAVRADKAWI